MQTPLTSHLQSVIIAVQSYMDFVHADAMAKDKMDADFNGYDMTVEYFKTLPLPDGMKHSADCLHAMLFYPIEETLDTERDDLPLRFEFKY